MGAVTGTDAWEVDVAAVNTLSKRLLACADALARSAGGVPRGLDMPDDRHHVRRAFVGLDEEREKLDQRRGRYLVLTQLDVTVLVTGGAAEKGTLTPGAAPSNIDPNSPLRPRRPRCRPAHPRRPPANPMWRRP